MKFKPLHAIAITLLTLGGAIAASPPAPPDVAAFNFIEAPSLTACALENVSAQAAIDQLATIDTALGRTNLEAVDVVNVAEADTYDTRAEDESAKHAGAPPNAIASHPDLELHGQPPPRAVLT